MAQFCGEDLESRGPAGVSGAFEQEFAGASAHGIGVLGDDGDAGFELLGEGQFVEPEQGDVVMASTGVQFDDGAAGDAVLGGEDGGRGGVFGQEPARCRSGSVGVSDAGDDLGLEPEAFRRVLVARGAFLRGPDVGVSAEEGDATVALVMEVGDGPAGAVAVVADDGVAGGVGEDAVDADHRRAVLDLTSEELVAAFCRGDDQGRPVLGSGDLAALFTDNPAAEEFMRFMTDPEWLGPQVDSGFDFSPFQTFPIENHESPTQRAQAEYLAEADAFNFDASDRMPGEVGSNSFWREMVRWINDETTLEEALAAIDESWPQG